VTVGFDDAEVRAEALESIERGLIEFTTGLMEGAENEFLAGRVKEIMSRLQYASSYFLTEITVVPSGDLFNNVFGGIEDETMMLEYMLFSPSKVAILDIRKALGVENLLDTSLEQRKGLRTALNVSHTIRFVHSQRSGTDAARPPHAGFVTAEVLSVILQHPDREEAIASYVRERNLVSDEIIPELLNEYLTGTAPLAAGML
jgi:hypothetical protein